MPIKIKNWEEFQHYTDRCPPWIKLHKNTLENRAIAMLSDCNYRILTGLWLLASEDKNLEGNLPPIDDIAFRLRKTSDEIKQAILELSGFLEHDDSVMPASASSDIAECNPSRAQVKTETETETETEERQRHNRARVAKPADVSEEVWKDFTAHRKRKRADLTATALKGIVSQAKKAGWSLEDALREICERGWTGFKAEWVEKNKRPKMDITGNENYDNGTEGFIVE